MISIGTVSEYRTPFDVPHHDMMQDTRSVDSRSPWHETPIPLPTIAGKLYNLTEYPLLKQKSVFSVETHVNRGVPIPTYGPTRSSTIAWENRNNVNAREYGYYVKDGV